MSILLSKPVVLTHERERCVLLSSEKLSFDLMWATQKTLVSMSYAFPNLSKQCTEFEEKQKIKP